MDNLTDLLPSWKTVLRDGFWKARDDRGELFVRDSDLGVLLDGLLKDDIRLMQGLTTTPPPMQCTIEWPCEGACFIGYVGWLGHGLATVRECEEFFAALCFAVDQLIGEPAVCRYTLNQFDDLPRDEMRREFAAEIRLEQARRGVELASTALAVA